jgi:hypothetical protein
MHVHVLYYCICLVKYSVIKCTRLRSPYNLSGRLREGVQLLHYSFLTFDSQRHVPGALTPGKKPGTYCTGDWVGHRTGLGGCGDTHAENTTRVHRSPPLATTLRSRYIRCTPLHTISSKPTLILSSQGVSSHKFY